MIYLEDMPQAIYQDIDRDLDYTQVDVQSIFGREYYYFTSSDPRFEGET
jgi:hypothetical protein